MGGLFAKLFGAFYAKKRDIVLVGLDNSGKSTLLGVLASDAPITETCPTIGMHVQVVKKNNVVMKCWDIGGQKQYRSEWGRYAKGCDAIVFVVDVADVSNAFNIYSSERRRLVVVQIDRVGEARKELHRLLESRYVQSFLVCVQLP